MNKAKETNLETLSSFYNFNSKNNFLERQKFNFIEENPITILFWKVVPGCLPYTTRVSPLPCSVGVRPGTPPTLGNISYIQQHSLHCEKISSIFSVLLQDIGLNTNQVDQPYYPMRQICDTLQVIKEILNRDISLEHALSSNVGTVTLWRRVGGSF